MFKSKKIMGITAAALVAVSLAGGAISFAQNADDKSSTGVQSKKGTGVAFEATASGNADASFKERQAVAGAKATTLNPGEIKQILFALADELLLPEAGALGMTEDEIDAALKSGGIIKEKLQSSGKLDAFIMAVKEKCRAKFGEEQSDAISSLLLSRLLADAPSVGKTIVDGTVASKS